MNTGLYVLMPMEYSRVPVAVVTLDHTLNLNLGGQQFIIVAARFGGPDGLPCPLALTIDEARRLRDVLTQEIAKAGPQPNLN